MLGLIYNRQQYGLVSCRNVALQRLSPHFPHRPFQSCPLGPDGDFRPFPCQTIRPELLKLQEKITKGQREKHRGDARTVCSFWNLECPLNHAARTIDGVKRTWSFGRVVDGEWRAG